MRTSRFSRSWKVPGTKQLKFPDLSGYGTAAYSSDAAHDETFAAKERINRMNGDMHDLEVIARKPVDTAAVQVKKTLK